jgi:hypothetical protein
MRKLKDEPGADQLTAAVEYLQHYHVEHTSDMVTRFTRKSGDGVDIYIVSDPVWKRKLADFMAPIFKSVESRTN